MSKREAPQPKRVTRVAPVTGTQYQAIQQQLGIDVATYLARLGGTMRDHYLATHDPHAPLADITLSLHLRLLDRYPDLVEPEPTAEDLLLKIRKLARAQPSQRFPMRLTATFVALLLGRNPRSSSMWNVGKAAPAGKVTKLIKDLMTILDHHPDPLAFLQEYLDLVIIEAGVRGEHQLFTAKKWPNPHRARQGAGAPAAEEDAAHADRDG